MNDKITVRDFLIMIEDKKESALLNATDGFTVTPLNVTVGGIRDMFKDVDQEAEVRVPIEDTTYPVELVVGNPNDDSIQVIYNIEVENKSC